MAQGHKGAGMDAGLAAVLGALAGSVATIGAALATGWAQRESALITVRSEHRRDRREPRQNAYKEFISIAHRMRNLTAAWAVDVNLTPEIDDTREEAWSQTERTLKQVATDAVLAGPTPVAKAAIELTQSATQLVINLKTYRQCVAEGQGRLVREMRRQLFVSATEFDAALSGFMLIAQSALDDDGSL